jgi:steroid delta-isomerase-like uncharacterized protein
MLALDRRHVVASLAAIPLLMSLPGVSFASDNVGVVEGYMAAWNAHDAAAAAAFFADDVEYLDASIGAPQIGRDSARDNVIQAFLTAVPDAQWVMNGDAVSDDDQVSFEWTFSGTNTGDWSDGTKATGKPFSIMGVSMVRLKDGKIVYQADYYDALGFYKQLGLM